MPSRPRIMIIDDDVENCQMLTDVLNPFYHCVVCHRGDEALGRIGQEKPALILLDYRMPHMNGLEICKAIRVQAPSLKIIFVSGVANIDERIQALESGADDFVTRPFNNRELLLRMKARLQVAPPSVPAELTAGNLKMNILARRIYVGPEERTVTPKQFEILRLLMQNKNKLVTRTTFMEQVWGPIEVTTRNVDSQINYLKRHLKGFAGDIRCVTGQGYKLESMD